MYTDLVHKANLEYMHACKLASASHASMGKLASETHASACECRARESRVGRCIWAVPYTEAKQISYRILKAQSMRT